MIFGVGTDLCKINRIKEVYAKHGDRFLDRVLTNEEQSKTNLDDRFLARRFAAKEACAKALGCGIGGVISFQDLSIVRKNGERPTVSLSGSAQKNFPSIQLHLSLSDDGEYAQAFAVAEKL